MTLAERDGDDDLRRFGVLCALFVFAATLPAMVQAVRTGGYLYYRNGADEGFYLQYGASLHTQGVSRLGQYLVTGLHNAGLPGGYINALLDATLPLGVLILVRAIGRALGLTARAATAGAFAVVLGPLLFNGANPLVGALFRFCTTHGVIRYLAVPDGVFVPVLRSPEPQFSFVLLGTGMLLGIRRRSLIPVYVVLPFLYPLIALPAAVVTIGLTIRRYSSVAARYPILAPLAACGVVSVGAGVMGVVFVGATMRELLVPSHVPVASLTSALALLGWLPLRHRLDPEWRARALLVAVAPMAAENTHVITGWLVAPNEIELYAGGLCAALVCGGALFGAAARAGAARTLPAGRWLTAAAVTVFVVRVLAANVGEVLAAPLMEQPVLDALHADARRVVWSDGRRSRLLALVFARQEPTALDFGQTWPQSDPDAHFDRYLAVRRAILADPRAPAFASVLAALDAGYAHANDEGLFLVSGRNKQTYTVNRDVPLEASRRTARATDLIYVVERTPGRLEIDR